MYSGIDSPARHTTDHDCQKSSAGAARRAGRENPAYVIAHFFDDSIACLFRFPCLNASLKFLHQRLKLVSESPRQRKRVDFAAKFIYHFSCLPSRSDSDSGLFTSCFFHIKANKNSLWVVNFSHSKNGNLFLVLLPIPSISSRPFFFGASIGDWAKGFLLAPHPLRSDPFEEREELLTCVD